MPDLNLATALPPTGILDWRSSKGPFTTSMDPCGKDLEKPLSGAAQSHDKLTARGSLDSVLAEGGRVILKHQPGMLEIQTNCWFSLRGPVVRQRLPNPCAPIPPAQERDGTSALLSTQATAGTLFAKPQFSSLGC